MVGHMRVERSVRVKKSKIDLNYFVIKAANLNTKTPSHPQAVHR